MDEQKLDTAAIRGAVTFGLNPLIEDLVDEVDRLRARLAAVEALCDGATRYGLLYVDVEKLYALVNDA